MLSFEKCKELFDAGLRRESVKAGDFFYDFGERLNLMCAVYDKECRTYVVTEEYGHTIRSVSDIKTFWIPVFTLEEIVAALHAGFGIAAISFDRLTVQHAANVYLEYAKASVPEKPLEIKLGGIYRTREGGVMMVYAIFKDAQWPVRGVTLNSGTSDWAYSLDGRYGKEECVLDLVRLIGTVDQIVWSVGDPMWRRKSDGSWVRSIVNETYLELIQEDPYSYVPVYENGRFVRSDVSEAELKRQAFMESMKQW